LTGDIATGPWKLTWLAKLALGKTFTNTGITGETVVAVPTVGTFTSVGGFLALPTNIGSYETSRFTVASELGGNVSYRISSNLRVFAGYSVLYWTGLIRPGGTIDTTINPNVLPNSGVGGAARRDRNPSSTPRTTGPKASTSALHIIFDLAHEAFWT
jgi:hypothetical protein